MEEEQPRKQPLRVREGDPPDMEGNREKIGQGLYGAIGKKMEKIHHVNPQKGKTTFGTGDVSKCSHRISQGPSRLLAAGTVKSLKLSGK